MYKFSMFLLLCIVSGFGSATPLHVELNIYNNISFLTKIYTLQNDANISLYLPSQINLENININTTNCKKNSLTLHMATSLRGEKEKELTVKIAKLSNKIINIQAQNAILKTITLEKKSTEQAQETLSFFSKNYIKNLHYATELAIKLKQAKKELDTIQQQKKKKYKKLDASFVCRDIGKVSITYPQYDFKIAHFYEIKADVKQKRLNFIKKIKIKQKSGEDFRNIDIISHSNSYNQRVQPTPFYPRYLNIYKQRKTLYAKSTNTMHLSDASKGYRQNLTTSSFVLKNISLPNNKAEILTLEDKIYTATFQNDIDGYGSNLAYLKASFKSDRYYQNSRAYIYLNTNQVGIINLKRIEKNTKVDIYLGENQNIKVKKTLLKRYNESEFFGSNQINTQVWQYSITNQNNSTQKINLIERIPISQNEDIKVEPLFDAKKAKISKKGRVVWSFKIATNKTKKIKFGYKTTKPKE